MERRTIIDLSHPLTSSTPVYPGDVNCKIDQFLSIQKDGCSVHSISLGSHTGTHIDAPSHFIQDGLTIDKIPLSQLHGNCVIVDVTQKNDREKITWEDLAPYVPLMKAETPLIIHTGWSKYWGTDRYHAHPFLTKDSAERLVSETEISLIGVDTFSPDETSSDDTDTEGGFGFHEVFLGAGRLIVENLCSLDNVSTGDEMFFVPLKLEGCDGSPVRAFVFKK